MVAPMHITKCIFMSWFEYTRNDKHSLQCVADPGCLYRIQESWIVIHLGSRIQPQQQKRRGKKFAVLPFVVATNLTKLKIIYFEQVLKTI